MTDIRTVFGFGLIGLALVGAGFGVSAKLKQDAMQLQLTKQDAMVSEQHDTIGKQAQLLQIVQEGISRDDATLKGLREDLAKFHDRQYAADAKVSQLEKSNAEVSDLLHSRLPGTGCLLDDSCASAGTAGGADQAVNVAAAGMPSPAHSASANR